MQRLSDRGMDLIKEFEGLRLRAYRDQVGIWTIGYGHTGPEVHRGNEISEERAEELLREDVARFEDAVRALVKVEITQEQFDALVSFCFNVGIWGLQRSTLLRLLNEGEIVKAAAQFPRWNKGRGKALAGLTRRRRAERELFESVA